MSHPDEDSYVSSSILLLILSVDCDRFCGSNFLKYFMLQFVGGLNGHFVKAALHFASCFTECFVCEVNE